MDAPLQGRTIAITADRRSAEQGALFAARGADVIHGPTMQTLDLRQDRDLRSVTVELILRTLVQLFDPDATLPPTDAPTEMLGAD